MHVISTSSVSSPSRVWAFKALTIIACGSAVWNGTANAAPNQPSPPCHPNPHARADGEAVEHRGDVRHLPDPLRERLEALAERPHSALPTQAYAEADQPSQLFQYYLLETTGFEALPPS